MHRGIRDRVSPKDGKKLARTSLALTTSFLIAVLLLAGSVGATKGVVLAQGSPSPSPSGPAGPSIKLLNPSNYDPVLVDPGEPADSPNISDKFDGTDREYHVVAVTKNAPANSFVEAYWEPADSNEITAGPMQLVSGSDDTWELFWDIPPTLPEGEGIMRVRLYEAGFGTPEEVANDEIGATMRHEGAPDSDPFPAEETVELTWPTNAGPLGFFKSRTGAWRTVIEGTVSQFGSQVRIAYSTTPIDKTPVWNVCAISTGTIGAQGGVTGANAQGFRTFRHVCPLSGAAKPSQVTAVAAVAMEQDTPTHSGVFTNDSADIHRVRTYLQDPGTMKITLTPVPPGTPSANWPTGSRRLADSDCLEFDAFVTDHLDRPVQGANVDLHLTGPNDQVGFGDEGSNAHGSSDDQPPNNPENKHSNESGRDCDDAIDTPQDDTGGPFGTQGDHNVPAGDDLKHIESAVGGTGMSGPPDIAYFFGKFRFHLYSEAAGFSDVTVWVDEPQISDESQMRAADSDSFDLGEASATLEAQWMPSGLTLGFAPAGQSSTPGACIPFTIRARAGAQLVPGINVDVHATGPNNDLDFCDPANGSPKRAPDHPDSQHAAEDPGESSHSGAPPQPQHTEGETDDTGNFVIGLISPVTGDTTIEAWVDGEPGTDNDVFNTGEVRGTATINWLASLAEAQLSFINPSFYGTGTSGGGNGTRVAATRDADTQYHVVVRVDAIGVPGIELLTSTDGTTFRKIGDMTQIGATDLWEFYWSTDVSGSTLRAQIPGTDRREDIAISVNNTSSATARAWETAEIASPIDGTVVAFTSGATEIRGIASAGAEGVELYYTKAPAKDTPQSADWIFCGYIDLNGAGTTPQEFKGDCRLAANDQAALVTGVAAITFDCSPILLNDGCNGNPAASPARQPGEKDSGDAHRVFGFEGTPVLSIEPAESAGKVETCQRLVLSLSDQTAQPLGDENVDIHVSGPDDNVSFCDVDEGTDLRAPDQGSHTGLNENEGFHSEEGPDSHHAEAETKPNGDIVFGIRSDAEGDANIVAWLDRNNDDLAGGDEASDTALLHWQKPGGKGGNKRCTKQGTARADVLRGTTGRDVLCGRGGRDRILGKGGNDVIIGGRGKDVLIGNGGRDTLRAGRGNDVLRAGSGRDTLNGGSGNDRINGGGGRDVCRGGTGRNRFKKCERRR